MDMAHVGSSRKRPISLYCVRHKTIINILSQIMRILNNIILMLQIPWQNRENFPSAVATMLSVMILHDAYCTSTAASDDGCVKFSGNPLENVTFFWLVDDAGSGKTRRNTSRTMINTTLLRSPQVRIIARQ